MWVLFDLANIAITRYKGKSTGFKAKATIRTISRNTLLQTVVYLYHVADFLDSKAAEGLPTHSPSSLPILIINLVYNIL